jgi:hypothetical protein
MHPTFTNWPAQLYSQLSRVTIFVSRLAAALYEIVIQKRQLALQNHPMGQLPPNLYHITMPTDEELYAAAVHFKNTVPGIGQDTADLLRIIIEDGKINDVDIPWHKRTVYRSVGMQRRVIGAVINLSRRRDSNGVPLTDFIDIFHALEPIVDYMWCPSPVIFLNRTGESHVEKEDPNWMRAGIGPLKIAVCEEMELSIADTCKENVKDYIDMVVKALADSEIIDPLQDVTVTSFVTRYIKTVLPLTPMSVYLTALFNPLTILKNFYYNENNRSAFGCQNDVLYYTSNDSITTKSFTSHVYIHQLCSKEGTFSAAFDYADGLKLNLYTISIRCSNDAELACFEKDFMKMLHVMNRDFVHVNAFLQRIGTRTNIDWISPPSIGNFTRAFTNKPKGTGTEFRSEPQNRPIYVPPYYVDGRARARAIAEIIANARHGSIDEVYVSCECKIVKLSSIGNKKIDSFSALCVSNTPGMPVENHVTNGTAVIPWVFKSKSNNTASPANPLYDGIDPNYTWTSIPPHARQLTNATLFNALKIATRKNSNATLSELAAAAIPGGLEKLAPMSKPELFDHTIAEIIASTNDLNSTLHLRMLEFIFRCTIFVMVVESDLYADIKDKTKLTLERMRSSGLQVRDVRGKYAECMRFPSATQSDEEWPLVLIVKFYSCGWKYLPLTRMNLNSSDMTWRNSTVDSDDMLIRGELRKNIIESLFSPMKMYDFDLQRTVVPIDDDFMSYFVRNNVKPVSQTICTDGYACAVTFEGRRKDHYSALAEFYCAKGSNTDKTANFELEELIKSLHNLPPNIANENILITTTVTHRVMPYPIPIRGEYHRITSNDYAFLSNRMNLEAKTTMEGVPMLCIRTCILLMEKKEEINVPLEIVKYQRQMVVLLSLFHAFAVNMRAINVGHVDMFMKAIVDHSAEVPRSNIIVAKNRFLPSYVVSASGDDSDVFERFREALRAYFPGFMAITENTLKSLKSYIYKELYWIFTVRPPPTAILYIDGILEYGQNKSIFITEMDPLPWHGTNSPTNMSQNHIRNAIMRNVAAAYRSPQWGEASIVFDMKSYEYATIRYAAKHSLTSCVSFVDLTGVRTAAGHKFKSAFVERLKDGVVVYGIAATDSSAASAILAAECTKYGFPSNYVPMSLTRFDMLVTTTFRTNALATFCTSSNGDQGSWYRLYIFVPGGRQDSVIEQI